MYETESRFRQFQAGLLEGMGFKIESGVFFSHHRYPEVLTPEPKVERNLRKFISSFRIKDPQINGEEIILRVFCQPLSHVYPDGKPLFQTHAVFFADGPYSIVLGIRVNSEINWGCVLSFRPPTDEEIKKGCNPDSPVIIQIQTVDYEFQEGYSNPIFIKDDKRRKEILNFLKKIGRWEHLLVKIIIEWAQKNKLPAVCISEASANPYYPRSYEDQQKGERLKMRYDVTASRLGFIRNKEAGLWVLHLCYTQD